MLPGVFCRQDHPFDAAAAETAGNDDSLDAFQRAVDVPFVQVLGIDPLDLYPRIQRVAGMPQRLRHGEIRVMQLRVFPDQCDPAAMVLVADSLNHLPPFGQIRCRRVDVQLPADDGREVCFLQHQRGLIQDRQRHVLDHAVRFDVAEVGDLAEDGIVRNLFIYPQHNDVRCDSHALQFLHGVLRGFGLVLAAGFQIRHQRHMDIQRVLPADLDADLPDRFDERLALDVADRAADLGNDDVRVRLLADPVDEPLDLVRHVRDDLDRRSKISALPLLVEHVGKHLPGRQVGIFVQILVDEPLIVAEVQIRFRAVLRHIDFAVLVGAHRAGIHVDVGVKLLCRDLQPASLQQPSDGRRRNSFSKAGHHAACHKNILGHRSLSSSRSCS